MAKLNLRKRFSFQVYDFLIGQQLSLQGLCSLLQKKYCPLNIHFVCGLSRINSFVSLKFDSDSSLNSSDSGNRGSAQAI